jgi:hypothetical protein
LLEIFRGLGMPLSLFGLAGLTTAVWARTLRSRALLLVVAGSSAGAAAVYIASSTGAIPIDAQGLLERDFFGVPWLQRALTIMTLAILASGVFVCALRIALGRFARRGRQV